MTFQREKQNVSANQLLQAVIDGDNILLSQCTITDSLDINRLFDANEKFQTERLEIQQTPNCKIITLSQSIVFDKCTFEENVVFAGPWSEPDSIKINFKENIIFNSSTFNAQTRFRNATSGGIASFDGCTFGGIATFRNASFQKDAKYRTVAFKGFVLFGDALFGASAKFTNSHFARGTDFSNVKFQSETNFSGTYSSSRSVPTCNSIYFAYHKHGDDESFWRFVKQSAQEAGHYQLAGECFYKERCSRLQKKARGPYSHQACSPSKKLIRTISSIRLLPELVFGKMLFGYGERPARVLAVSAVIILFCAFFYWAPGSLDSKTEPVETSFMQGLYFSTITFTTLGYGDLYPANDGVSRIVAMAEAVSGVFMMA
jgi:hypothetical protein